MDVRYSGLLKQSYNAVEASYRDSQRPLPQNGGRELKLRKLDCVVINNLAATLSEPMDTASERIHTVRGAFEEGDEAFPGAALKMETHIQIAVRERQCILGVFRPTDLDEEDGEQ